MTTTVDYDIVGSYDNQRYTAYNSERTVNMFEYLDPNGKQAKVLFPTSGLVDSGLDFSPETGGSRASYVTQNAIYQVFGESVYRITGTTGNLTKTRIGSLNTQTGYVKIDANQTQVMFVDGLNGWIWDTTNSTWEQITDTGFPAQPIDLCYLDGFFVVIEGETNNFQLSMINQGMVWSAGFSADPQFTADSITDEITITGQNTSNFATGIPFEVSNSGGALPTPLVTGTTYYAIRVSDISVNPGVIRVALTRQDALDNIYIDLTTNGSGINTIHVLGEFQQGSVTSHPGTLVGCRTLHRRIFFFSQNFTEVWENEGLGTNLPFRRNNSLLLEIGTPAVGSIAVGFDMMFFLSQDRDGLSAVVAVSGTEAVPVSIKSLDYQLAKYAADPLAGVSDARAILMKEKGLIFYRLNFTAANHTFVFNESMSTQDNLNWHEEEVLNHDRHPAQTACYYNGINYCGDYQSPIFYYFDNAVSTNNGENIRRMRIGKEVTPDGLKRLRIDRFHLDLLQGNVENVGTNVAPIVFLQVSKDGGQTYGNYYPAPMGQIGQRTFRTVWRKLGTTPRGQGFTPKFEFFSAVPFVILGAAWAYEVLPE